MPVAATPTGGSVAAGWGSNSEWTLGDGTDVSRSSAAPVSGLPTVTGVSGGDYEALAIRASDGAVLAWGSGGYLGDGTTAASMTPVVVQGLTDVSQVAAGCDRNFALAGGQVYAWGDGAYLGFGNETSVLTPQPVPSLTNIVQIAAGCLWTMALTADGHVYTWGSNSVGQLADPTLMDQYTPFLVPTLAGIWQIAAAGDHGLALDVLGNVWAWGNNNEGQLGNPTILDSPVPTIVPGLTNVRLIGAGRGFSLAEDSSGTVYGWGDNNSGQLGVDPAVTGSEATPTPIPGVTNADLLTGGDEFAIAAVNGKVLAWGSNTAGQLGDGTTASRFTPAAVPGLSGTTAADAGPNYVLANGWTPTADLAVSLTASPNPVRSHAKLTYTLAVTNAGPNSAADVVVSNQLPSGVTPVTATASAGSCVISPTNTVTCQPGSVPAGAAVTVTIEVRVIAAKSSMLTDAATVSSATADPNNTNNAAQVTTTVT